MNTRVFHKMQHRTKEQVYTPTWKYRIWHKGMQQQFAVSHWPFLSLSHTAASQWHLHASDVLTSIVAADVLTMKHCTRLLNTSVEYMKILLPLERGVCPLCISSSLFNFSHLTYNSTQKENNFLKLTSTYFFDSSDAI